MNAYEILHKYFIPAGFALVKHDWYPKKDGSTSYHAAIRSVQEGCITRIKDASHTDFCACGSSPDEAIKELFAIAKTEKLWLGPHGNYHSVIEWYAPDQRFLVRILTKEEELRQNCIL
ncbi:MAG TPA: hypothetical protein VGE18_00835 [Candidatus Paceibacterota bacterium]